MGLCPIPRQGLLALCKPGGGDHLRDSVPKNPGKGTSPFTNPTLLRVLG